MQRRKDATFPEKTFMLFASFTNFLGFSKIGQGMVLCVKTRRMINRFGESGELGWERAKRPSPGDGRLCFIIGDGFKKWLLFAVLAHRWGCWQKRYALFYPLKGLDQWVIRWRYGRCSDPPRARRRCSTSPPRHSHLRRP